MKTKTLDKPQAATADFSQTVAYDMLVELHKLATSPDGWSCVLTMPVSLVVHGIDTSVLQDAWAKWTVHVDERPASTVRYTIDQVGVLDLVPFETNSTLAKFMPAATYNSLSPADRYLFVIKFLQMEATQRELYNELQDERHDLLAFDNEVRPERRKQLTDEATQVEPIMRSNVVHPNRAAAIPTMKDSGHFAHPPAKRKEIVSEFNRARERGEVATMDRWAQGKYGISGRTLRNYIHQHETET